MSSIFDIDNNELLKSNVDEGINDVILSCLDFRTYCYTYNVIDYLYTTRGLYFGQYELMPTYNAYGDVAVIKDEYIGSRIISYVLDYYDHQQNTTHTQYEYNYNYQDDLPLLINNICSNLKVNTIKNEVITPILELYEKLWTIKYDILRGYNFNGITYVFHFIENASICLAIPSINQNFRKNYSAQDFPAYTYIFYTGNEAGLKKIRTISPSEKLTSIFNTAFSSEIYANNHERECNRFEICSRVHSIWFNYNGESYTLYYINDLNIRDFYDIKKRYYYKTKINGKKIKACSKLIIYNFDVDSEWQQLKYKIKTDNSEFFKIFRDLFEYITIHDYSYSKPISVADFKWQFNKINMFNSSDTYITKASTDQNNYE
jgi:hypothetical protein